MSSADTLTRLEEAVRVVDNMMGQLTHEDEQLLELHNKLQSLGTLITAEASLPPHQNEEETSHHNTDTTDIHTFKKIASTEDRHSIGMESQYEEKLSSLEYQLLATTLKLEREQILNKTLHLQISHLTSAYSQGLPLLF